MSTESILTCPGCGLGGFSAGKDGIPSRSYYIHCLFKCFKYLELNLAKTCLNCNVLLLNQEELNVHQVTCPEKNKDEELVEGSMSVTEESMSVTEESTDELGEDSSEESSDFECNHCLIKFKHEQDLKCHIKCIHESLKCPTCQVEFKAVRHRFRKHAHIHGDMFKDVPVLDTQLEHNYMTYFKRNVCKLCKKTITRTRRLKEHFETHIGHQYQCKWCPRVTSTKPGLDSHYVRHHLDKPRNVSKAVWMIFKGQHNKEEEKDPMLWIKCNICSITFKHQQDLDNHKMSIHKCIKCPSCPRTFEHSLSCGTNHIRSFQQHKHFEDGFLKIVPVINSSTKNVRFFFNGVKCSLCNQKIYRISHRVRHFMIHVGHKYKCPMCDVIPTSHSTFEKHVRKYHENVKMEMINAIWIVPRSDLVY